MSKKRKGAGLALLPFIGLILVFLLIAGSIFYLVLTAQSSPQARAQQSNIGKGQSPWGNVTIAWWIGKLHCYRPANALYCTDNAT